MAIRSLSPKCLAERAQLHRQDAGLVAQTSVTPFLEWVRLTPHKVRQRDEMPSSTSLHIPHH
jgi:hypothetical protein